MTIASSDSGGGAGIQADLKAFAAAGCHGMSAIVALTAQNTAGVTAIHELPPEFVTAQLDAVFDDIGVDAAKTGMLFSARLIETVADFLDAHPVPLVVDPVMVASSGAKLLEDDAVAVLVERLIPLATVVTPNVDEATALVGAGRSRRAGAAAREARRARGDRHGQRRGRRVLRRRDRAHDPGAAARQSARRTARAARTRRRSRRCSPAARTCWRLRWSRPPPRATPWRTGSQTSAPAKGPSTCSTCEGAMSDSPGAALRDLRERKPLIHQITNYVVMNETANATLAIGALPVMAHAVEEVEEMASAAGALVLNIGTLSAPWIEAMLLAGKAANAAGAPVVLDPVGVGATTFRTETAKRILDEVDVAIVRGNAAEVAALAGLEAEIRGVEAIGAKGSGADIARTAASKLGVVAAVTGPVDHVSDGTETKAVANGDALLATITGSGCISTALTGCFAAVRRADRRCRIRPGGARRRGGGCSARGVRPRDVPRAPVRRPLRADAGVARRARRTSPTHEAPLHRRGRRTRRALPRDGGATVIQLRLKDLPTAEWSSAVAPSPTPRATPASRSSSTTTSMRRSRSAADGVHLGRDDDGKERRAAPPGCCSGVSAANVDEAIAAAEQGADYIGAGPVWATPSKTDADAPIGLDGLAAICEAVERARRRDRRDRRVECAPTASPPARRGVAVIRASVEARGVRAAVDAAAR